MTNKDALSFYTGYSELTYADIQNFIGKTFNAQEQSVCTSLISSVESYIVRECKKNFYYKDGNDDQVYVETFDVGKEEYRFFNYPIKEVIKITIDGVVQYEKSGSNNLMKLNTDFFVYPYKIVFENEINSSTNNKQAMVIEYTIKQFWGDDVKLAIKMWVGQIMTSKEYGGQAIQSANVDGLSVSFDTSKIPDYVRTIINRYQKYLI